MFLRKFLIHSNYPFVLCKLKFCPGNNIKLSVSSSDNLVLSTGLIM